MGIKLKCAIDRFCVIVTVVCAPDVAEIAAMFGVVVVGFTAVVASIVFVVVVIYVFCSRLFGLGSVELQTGLRHAQPWALDASTVSSTNIRLTWGES